MPDVPATASVVRTLVVMGVCGTGKSTIGIRLADTLAWTYLDADDFHPPDNVTKMRSGLPLNDDDRSPWLARLATLIARHVEESRGLVLACSALKQAYRHQLIGQASPAAVRFVYLHGTRDLLASRLGAREGHFMPAKLLDSQLATLEEPAATENAIWCDVAEAPDALVAQITGSLHCA